MSCLGQSQAMMAILDRFTLKSSNTSSELLVEYF